MTDYTTAIMSYYLRATDDEVSTGMRWYHDVHDEAASLWPDVWQAAGVYAAYSINTPWWRNRVLARESLLMGLARTDALPISVVAAARIMSGEPAMEVHKGPKVRAFTAAIADPDNSKIATIDRHAYRVATGLDVSRPPKNEFMPISDAYNEVADMVGIGTAPLQAIAWVAYGRIHNVKARKRD